jgi:Uncharacterized conserved protein (DUF2190)
VPTRHHIPEDLIAHPAGADLSLSQYRFVARDGSGNIVRAGAGAAVYGVLENHPKINQHAHVFFREGTYCLVVSGAAFARDAKLVSDAQGRAIDAGVTAGTNYVAIAEEAATAADQIVSVRLSRSQI